LPFYFIFILFFANVPEGLIVPRRELLL
jgi:hypothetical protein